MTPSPSVAPPLGRPPARMSSANTLICLDVTVLGLEETGVVYTIKPELYDPVTRQHNLFNIYPSGEYRRVPHTSLVGRDLRWLNNATTVDAPWVGRQAD